MSETPQRPRVRLFWRIYSFGLVLLVVIVISVLSVLEVLRRTAPPLSTAIELVDNLDQQSPAVLDNVPALRLELDRIAERTGGDVAVYRVDGTLVAATSDPPLEPLNFVQLHRLSRGPVQYPVVLGGRPHHAPWWARFRRNIHHFRIGYSAPLPSSHPIAYVSMALPSLAPAVVRLVAVLVVILVMLGVAAIPFARAIAAPIEQLTQSARAFGEGALGVRSGVRRRDEVGVLASAFDEMAERIQTLIQTEKELLANVSHELRTPLARIRVALELAEEGDADKVKASLGEVRTDLSELERLVGDILTAARLEVSSGKAAALPLHREPVAIGSLVERCVDRFREANPGRSVAVEIDSTLPQLELDAALMRRALDNLLDNARKYSDEDQPISVRARAADGSVAIEIADRGIGIDPSDLPKLFTPFFRTDRSRTRKSGGVGLGLVLARRIAEAHGGQVIASSALGEGTTMRVTLPGA